MSTGQRASRSQVRHASFRQCICTFTKLAELDLSICPSNVGANTASTAGLIGEKAAFIIAQELGMTGPFQMLHTFGMLGP